MGTRFQSEASRHLRTVTGDPVIVRPSESEAAAMANLKCGYKPEPQFSLRLIPTERAASLCSLGRLDVPGTDLDFESTQIQ
jgi:hypothetical protein